MSAGSERREGVARPEFRARRRRRPEGAVPPGDRGRPGMEVVLQRGESLCAWLQCNRSPNEDFHEVPSDPYRHRRGGQGGDQRRHGLSHRAGPATAIAKEGATGAAPARSAGRYLRRRSRAHAGSLARLAAHRHFRGDGPSSPRAGRRCPSDPGAPHSRLARHSRGRARGHFPAGA